MPVIFTDPADDPGQTKEVIYVWACLGEPGKYGLCTNPEYTGYKTANWKLLGELSQVDELATFPRTTIDNMTVGGWPRIITVLGQRQFYFGSAENDRD